MTSHKGKTIITYLVNGEPNGLKTVEFSNKLIKGISIPRKELKDAIIKREELKYSGIYFLMGKDEEGSNMSYIGQATRLAQRLNHHYRDTSKDFWNNAICFTYKDGSLNESDINYLEREIINTAKHTDRYEIINNTGGNHGLMQEHRLPDMMEFVEDLKILISNLGHNLLTKLKNKDTSPQQENTYYLTKRGSDAQGVYTDEGFLILQGSTGPKQMTKSEITRKGYAFRHRPKLLLSGTIQEINDTIVFQKDYLCSSPSMAAAILMGRNANGRTNRTTKEGKTMDEILRKDKEI